MRIWCPAIINGVITNWKEFFTTEVSESWKNFTQLARLQIRYWASHDKEAAAHRVQVASQEYSARLENLLPDTQYFVEVRACNSAGCGPPSDMIETFTKKARESQYLHYILAKIPNWLNDTGTGERNLLARHLSTFGFQF